jgi:hypothetical protein
MPMTNLEKLLVVILATLFLFIIIVQSYYLGKFQAEKVASEQIQFAFGEGYYKGLRMAKKEIPNGLRTR